MELTFDTTDGLPDHIKPIVQEADGKYTLNLAGLVPASELETFKGKALTAQQEAIDRRKALDAWKALGGTPEEIREKLSKGADPAIIEQMRTQHATELAARDTRIRDMITRSAMAELKAELSKSGVVPEGLDLIANFAATRLKIEDDGGITVLSPDGKTPMTGKAANGGATLSDLAAQLAGAIPQLVADNGKGGSGKQPGQNGGTPKPAMTRAQYEALSPAEKNAALKSGVKITD